VTLVLRTEAEADLRETYGWYEERRTGLGVEFVDAVDEMFARIEEAPQSFAIAHRVLRRAVMQRFPYIVYFRELGGVVEVFGVLHGRRHLRVLRARASP